MNNPTEYNFSFQRQMLEIYKHYPSLFSYERVSVCSKIYYPITIIDVLVEENIRQPFSPLELMVLQLIRSGVNKVEELAAAIGLPELYVQSILQDLEDDELIKENMLTSKGEYGHEQKVKFSFSAYKRRIQFDPILHEVLNHKEIDETYFVPSQLTNSGTTHFLPHSHFNLKDLEKSFDVVQEQQSKVTGKRIKEVLNVKTYFVEVVAIQYNLIPHPFIFFPNHKGECIELISMSEANLNFMKEVDHKRMTIDRSLYYEIWLYVKQIKDEMKKKQDNQLLVRDIKTKVSHAIEFCNVEHTVMTDSGLSIVLDINQSFTFNRKTFNAIQSLEWTNRHLPFLVLEYETDYSNFIAYSECYDRKLYDLSKLIFELDQVTEPNTLYTRISKALQKLSLQKVSISQLFDLLTQMQTEHKLNLKNVK